ncbi:putative MFS family arabinose efflux permease [Sphingobium sp. B11D3D]|uniref:MFS transporter n=2 Tax=unclassified Sphingobium TaxID=2611147 RepID=UPI002224F934|nr:MULTISPECIES: MFS transporter [unclassified Sphingobium]MCW2350407.1 putative MFS family arabinose efflux permease [Sphingobium sp. B12D2B]MCW2369510.1 putative MFS family arabinose efflux permease [Sphingobium sp. B11D3D]
MEGLMVMGDAGTPRLRSGGYQAWLVGLLSLNFGIVFFDRQALNVLMPFVQPELGLSNAQIGLLAGGLSFTWAIAAFAIGRLSDTIGNRKLLLVGATLGFSLCCFLSGMATSFLFMLCARMLMGAAEGGVMPISHAMVASEVDPRRRGLAQGIAQNFGSNLLGSFLAPVLLVWFGLEFGWRNAFFLASIPGIICALLIWFTLEEPAAPARPQVQDGQAQGVLSVLRTRNVLVCVLLGVLMVSYFVICLTFLPIYLTSVRSYTPTEMSWLIATLGISATIGSFAISGLSDWIGRRPVMIAMPLLGIILPLGALYWSGSIWGLVPIFFFGWGLNGIFPLFMATVPSESVDPRQAATALGLTMGSAEILGGVFAPSLAGVAADATSLAAPLWIMVVLAILGGIVAMFLTETAPSQRARTAVAA